MNLDVQLDDEMAARLDAASQETGTPSEEIVRLALSAWLSGSRRRWPAVVIECEGDPEFPAFESWRSLDR